MNHLQLRAKVVQLVNNYDTSLFTDIFCKIKNIFNNLTQEQAISIANTISPILNLPTIISDKNTYSYTGTTAMTILGTPILIPANTFKNLDAFVIRGLFTKSGNNDTFNLRFFLNPAPNFTGFNVIWIPANGFVNNKDNTTYTVTTAPYLIDSGNIYGSFGGSENANNNYNLNNAPAILSSFSFNPTIDNYLFAANVLSTGVDTFTQKFLQIETI